MILMNYACACIRTAPTLVQPTTTSEIVDDVTQAIIQEIAKEELIAAYYNNINQEKAIIKEFGFAKETLKCVKRGGQCGVFVGDCCGGTICIPPFPVGICS